MTGYYFPVEIHGIALVYAESEYEARLQLENAGCMVAGNKLRHSNIEILDDNSNVLLMNGNIIIELLKRAIKSTD